MHNLILGLMSLSITIAIVGVGVKIDTAINNTHLPAACQIEEVTNEK